MALEQANATLALALGNEPWLINRGELSSLEDAHPELDWNSIWEFRYLAEEQAVAEGRWPQGVPIPPKLD